MPNAIQIRRFASANDFRNAASELEVEWKARLSYEETLAANRSEFSVVGYCIACQRVVDLAVDLKYSDGVHPNWRERLVCPCGLNNRIRAALHFLELELNARSDAALYATEQVTPLGKVLSARYPNALLSEFLQDGTQSGQINSKGIRHENLCALSLADHSMDVVLSFDVLEHIPDYWAASREIARVLRPGGRMLASFPFDGASEFTVCRANVDADGNVRHILPPEYHGDPINSGECLCFQVFGWDILDVFRSAGFSEASALYYWSAEYGYLGAGQFMFVATR